MVCGTHGPNTWVDMKKKCFKEEERLEVVDLSGLSLNVLPNNSLNLGLICKLDLSNNHLQNIPESLTARLLNLVVLDVRSNQLKALPNSIGCLWKLKTLNVSGNLIQCLPKTIKNCRSLEELNVNFNKLTILPDTIGFELVNLKKLKVNSNKLTYLPRSTSHLTSLQVLDARLNCLQSLPDDLENLMNLQILNISQNFHHLTTLPYSIGLLMSLVELDISYNKISVLPNSIGCLGKLKKLCIEGNPLVSPPIEVMEVSLDAVKEYLCDRMNNEYDTNSSKRRSWGIRNLVKYATFHIRNVNKEDEASDGLVRHCDYRQIDALASRSYKSMLSQGMFSPKLFFSRRRSFS